MEYHGDYLGRASIRELAFLDYLQSNRPDWDSCFPYCPLCRGFLIGLRISRAKELQDALEAYGVSPERLAISPENKGMVLPSAPDVSWSNDENS